MVKIESDVPLEKTFRKPAQSKWAMVFHKMKVGDSFLVEKTKIYSVKTSVMRYRDGFDSQFDVEVRQVELGNYRVWRVR